MTCISILAYLAAFLFVTDGEQCSDFTSSDGIVHYRFSNTEVNYTEALTQGTLLSIEDPETQELISAQMAVCNVSKVWLGMRQIEAHKQITEAQPWGWIPDCCHSSCDSAESLQTQYVGCYYESVVQDRFRDLRHSSGLVSSSVSVSNCIQACGRQAYIFAGVHYFAGDFHCYCGNTTIGRHGGADNCHLGCPADSSQSCGNDRVNAIYVTKDRSAWAKWAEYSNFGDNSFCAVLVKSQDYLLYDNPCVYSENYICEIESENNASCDDLAGFTNGNDIPHDGSCYYISDTAANWYYAMQICRENYGGLTYISSDAEHEFIKSWLGSFSLNRVWVGLHRNTLVNNEESSIPCYTNFAKEEPLQPENSYTFINSQASYRWQTTDDPSLLAATITQMVDDPSTSVDDPSSSGNANDNLGMSDGNAGTSGDSDGNTDTSGDDDFENAAPVDGTQIPNVARQENDDNSGSFGLIIFGIIMCSLMLIAIIVAIFYFTRKKQEREILHIEPAESKNVKKQSQEESFDGKLSESIQRSESAQGSVLSQSHEISVASTVSYVTEASGTESHVFTPGFYGANHQK